MMVSACKGMRDGRVLGCFGGGFFLECVLGMHSTLSYINAATTQRELRTQLSINTLMLQPPNGNCALNSLKH